MYSSEKAIPEFISTSSWKQQIQDCWWSESQL